MSDHPDRESVNSSESIRLDSENESSTVHQSKRPESIPEEIGQFHIRRLIAAGGMGAVYEAVQHHPRRTVALKIMKPGLTSNSALRRFEYEGQILARLRHQGIAQIY